MGEKLSYKWDRLVISDFNNPLLPDEPGVIKIVMEEPYFFMLMEDINGKKYWKGLFKDKNLAKLLKKEDTAAVEREIGGQKVIAITRCIYIEESPNIFLSVKNLANNYCITRLQEKEVELIAKYSLADAREIFLKELWSFLIKTKGVCPPAVCQIQKCFDMGGEKAPVFLDGEPLPC